MVNKDCRCVVRIPVFKTGWSNVDDLINLSDAPSNVSAAGGTVVSAFTKAVHLSPPIENTRPPNLFISAGQTTNSDAPVGWGWTWEPEYCARQYQPP